MGNKFDKTPECTCGRYSSNPCQSANHRCSCERHGSKSCKSTTDHSCICYNSGYDSCKSTTNHSCSCYPFGFTTCKSIGDHECRCNRYRYDSCRSTKNHKCICDGCEYFDICKSRDHPNRCICRESGTKKCNEIYPYNDHKCICDIDPYLCMHTKWIGGYGTSSFTWLSTGVARDVGNTFVEHFCVCIKNQPELCRNFEHDCSCLQHGRYRCKAKEEYHRIDKCYLIKKYIKDYSHTKPNIIPSPLSQTPQIGIPCISAPLYPN